jgi:hypothetical protein
MARRIGTPAPSVGAPKGKKPSAKQLNISKGKKLPFKIKGKK